MNQAQEFAPIARFQLVEHPTAYQPVKPGTMEKTADADHEQVQRSRMDPAGDEPTLTQGEGLNGPGRATQAPMAGSKTRRYRTTPDRPQ
jgi:hypothetical protein